MKMLKDCLIESNFGRIINRIEIVEIVCRKKLFEYPDGSTNLDDIELFGHAITAARAIKKTSCLLTDMDYLVFGGECSDSLSTIEVKIDIDSSVSQLASPLFYNRIKPGWGIKVAIERIPQEFRVNEQAICRFISDGLYG